MTDLDEFDLNRFLKAQENYFPTALVELIRGQKKSHWVWYIFPQVSGLGSSHMAKKFAIRSKGEAIAYMNHHILGQRLRQCAAALIQHREKSIVSIMGYPDNLKLCSSMTLFSKITEDNAVFHQVLDIFYSGEKDLKTLNFLDENQ